MIADGRETALIPFMLRPFRCTDTRGRQALCLYVSVYGVRGLHHMHTNDPPSYPWEEPPISLCLTVCEDQNGSSVRSPPPWIKERPLGHHYTWFEKKRRKKNTPHIFKVYVFHIISAFPQMWKQLWKCGVNVCLKKAQIIEYKSVYFECFSQWSVLLQARSREGKSKIVQDSEEQIDIFLFQWVYFEVLSSDCFVINSLMHST